jgi:hypothetical protein
MQMAISPVNLVREVAAGVRRVVVPCRKSALYLGVGGDSPGGLSGRTGVAGSAANRIDAFKFVICFIFIISSFHHFISFASTKRFALQDFSLVSLLAYSRRHAGSK